MIHHAAPSFWQNFEKLPEPIQKLAKRNFQLLKENPQHPSLHFKKINNYYSARVGIQYRALGLGIENGVVWFWIGSHADYDKMLSY